MSQGILFFASNNEHINYIKIALANAYMCKKNMGAETKISVVTSTKSLEWNIDLIDQIESTFDKIIIDDLTTGNDNMRRFSNTQYYSVKDEFINGNRNSAYDRSPYDETLLLDVDLLIQDSSMNCVWGNEEDFLINDLAIGLDHAPLLGEEFRLNPTGIKMVWATAIYFRKTERVQLIFELVSFIKEQWDYFKFLYGFGGYLYRNDFAFSIALHILNGYLENDEFKKLPTPFILTSTDMDQIYSVGMDTITIFYNDLSLKIHEHEHEFYLTKIKGHNVHIMNKLSLMPVLDELIRLYRNV
jgi:hypothetical protein